MERRRVGRGAEERANRILNPAGGGLLALDWNNGNRTVLVDQRLTGLLLGQTLGLAIAGAAVAGAHKDFASAQQAMTGLKPRVFKPNPEAHAVYQRLYMFYRKLHDAFGTRQGDGSLYEVMKELLEVRSQARR